MPHPEGWGGLLFQEKSYLPEETKTLVHELSVMSHRLSALSFQLSVMSLNPLSFHLLVPWNAYPMKCEAYSTGVLLFHRDDLLRPTSRL